MKIFHPLGGKGTLTSGYAQRWGRFHPGQDIAAGRGSPVHAAWPGVVLEAHTGCTAGNIYCGKGLGNHVVIDHKNGYYTLYAHLSSVLIEEGQKVAAGEQIGKEGTTGHSTGSHLHFEIRTNLDYVKKPGSLDPAPYLAGEAELPVSGRKWFLLVGVAITLTIIIIFHRRGYFHPVKTQIRKWLKNNNR